MSREKVLVYETKKIYQAEILKEILASHDIACFILNKMDSSYLFGYIQVLVDPDDVIRAKSLIEKFEAS